MNYYTRERLATDATEIYRDLGRPRDALAWSREADAMLADRYNARGGNPPRGRGIRASAKRLSGPGLGGR